MASPYDQEIEAIGLCLNALEPLDVAARRSVLDYVAKRLQIVGADIGALIGESKTEPAPSNEPKDADASTKEECHISELVEKKQPRSAIEMAVLVAYYLSHKAPKSERKQTISTEDLTTYFKIAEFKLPKSPQYTLPNTKSAGYLDSAGGGEYKLNPVGYNLIVHSMPKTSMSTRPSKRKLNKAKPKSKATKTNKSGATEK